MNGNVDLKSELEMCLLDPNMRGDVEGIARMIGGDPDRFSVAWDILCNGASPLPERMARVVERVTADHPSHAARYAASIAARLPYLRHPAEARACTKILSRTPIPLSSVPELTVLMFAWVEDHRQALAVRVHSMEILYQISNLIPELKREVALVIQTAAQEGFPSLQAKARNLLPKLQKELRKLTADGTV